MRHLLLATASAISLFAYVGNAAAQENQNVWPRDEGYSARAQDSRDYRSRWQDEDGRNGARGDRWSDQRVRGGPGPSMQDRNPMMGMAPGGMVGPGMRRMMFILMDTDGDGTISLAEFQSAHDRIFKAMDADKDGRLTMQEIQSFMRGQPENGQQRPGQ